MNFFGHTVIASSFHGDPRFLLGSMLPDFAGMVGVRLGAVENPIVRAGIDMHHRTDNVFHSSPQFVELMRHAMNELEAAGVSRGPARATAHLGIELLLDGLLSQDETRVRDYYEALHVVARMDELNLTQNMQWLRNVATRLQEAPLPHGYASPEFVAGRIEYILQSRPRLRLLNADAKHVRATLRGIQPALRDLQATWMEYVQQQVQNAMPEAIVAYSPNRFQEA